MGTEISFAALATSLPTFSLGPPPFWSQQAVNLAGSENFSVTLMGDALTIAPLTGTEFCRRACARATVASIASIEALTTLICHIPCSLALANVRTLEPHVHARDQ